MEADKRSVMTLCERALDGEDLTRDEIVVLLGLTALENLEVLRQAAEEGIRRWVGDGVEVLFRLSVSSHCEHNCLYCDLRRGNEDAPRYRLQFNQVVEEIRRVQRLDFGSVVIEGAQDPEIDAEWVVRLLDVLSSEHGSPSSVVLSLGERDSGFFERIHERGARRYILNHRTASPILYNELHPEHDYFDRFQCMQTLLRLGYEVGTAITVGLPHQDLWDLTDDFLQARELGLGTVIVGPFIPGLQSPLSSSPRGSIQRSLTAMAVARLVLRGARLSGGLSFGFLDEGSSVEALRWGADSMICNVAVGSGPDTEGGGHVAPICDSVTTRIRSLGRRLSESPRSWA